MTEPFQLGHFMAGRELVENSSFGSKPNVLTVILPPYVKSALKLSKPQKERKTCR